MQARLLVVDDDASFREILRFNLVEAGYEVDVADEGAAALRCFEQASYAVVFTDHKMPHMSGLELLRAIKLRAPDTVVVVITAFGELATAVEAMKAGAFDFLPKPCDREHLRLTVRRAVEHWSLQTRVGELESRLSSSGKTIIYTSSAMERTLAIADRIARSEGTVLLLGESGTGKELLARRIHRQSARRAGPFIAISCAAIPHELVESELFGHVRGAFTGAVRDRKGRFEQAHGGTLFLDEVAELAIDMQARLLRVLQERVVDVIGGSKPIAVDLRIVAATNRELRKAVDQGTFREDLYFRLAVLPIHVPALRDRPDDIPRLVEYFLRRYAPERTLAASDGLIRRLQAMPWRGNVRELENLCHRLALLSDEDGPAESLLDAELAESAPTRSTSVLELPKGGISLVDLERDVIVRALEMNGYNQTQTAKFLRIPRHVLLYRMEKFQIPLRGPRP